MPGKHYEQGTYKAMIVGHVFGESKAKKTPYLEIHIEPLQATGANTFPDKVYNRNFRLYFSEAAAPYSIENLRRIGWTGSQLSDLEPEADGGGVLVGMEVEVTCGYNDAGYEDWNLAYGKANAPKESAKGLSSKLDKLFGKALKSSVPKSVPISKEEVAAVSDEADDEVPF